MHGLRNFISLLILFATSYCGIGQTYFFANYGVKDGLAQSNVSGVVQDSSGFYYIGTAGGLSRFDGRHFINYTTEDGLADNNISAIFIDSRNVIWLGHENGALTRFDGKVFKEIKSGALPKDKKIYGFYEDIKGAIWIGTETKGAVQLVNPESNESNYRFLAYSGKEGLSQYVLSITEDKDGNLLFLTDIGLKILYTKTTTFDFYKPQGMPAGQVSSLYRKRNKNIVIGTVNGSISEYDASKKEFRSLSSTEDLLKITRGGVPGIIYTLYEDKNNTLWASVLNIGVLRINQQNLQSTLFNNTNGLSVNKIKCINGDSEGNVILGTAGEGIEVFSGEKFVSFGKNNGLADNQVWAVCKDKKGRMWIGTNEGLNIYDPTAADPSAAFQTINTTSGLPSNSVRALISDRNGNLWIGTWGGKVVKYDLEQSKLITISGLNEIVNSLVSCLMIDRNNKLWIGTLEGIVVYDLNTQSIKTYRTIDGLSDNDISCLYEQSNGHVWIGTKQKGITVFDGASFKKYNRENGLNHNSISSIAEDAFKNIWIGTESGGALVFNGKTFSGYKTKNGLLSDYITLITTTKSGQVWLGTNKGLNRYNPDTKTFTAYLKNDGFTGLETKPRAVFSDPDGSIWFGTVNGVFKYMPAFDKAATNEPTARLLKIQVNLNDYPVSNKLNLSYKENSLTFDFLGISLANPEAVTYKALLEGCDTDWKQRSNETQAVYSNLPPGNYTFKVITCNAQGVCNKTPLAIDIVITPPFWKTWWFYLVCAAGLMAVLFAYIKIRERSLVQEKKILEEKVNERTAEVVLKNKELDAKNQDITASIRYAKRIQIAILPPDDYVKSQLPNTFILFKPKDIVSGDFYWMESKNDLVLFAAVDCTGHGVPGAFMSIVGHNLLDRIISEQHITEPARILDELNRGLAETLRQSDHEDGNVKDGMDITLCSLNRKTGELQFAGAYNPLWLIRNNELTEIKGNKFPIGNTSVSGHQAFTNHKLQLQKGDTIYTFSDGYCDQFGGPQGKKFKASSLRQLLLSSQHLSMAQQKDLLANTIEEWRGIHEQVDDILVIGTRFD